MKKLVKIFRPKDKSKKTIILINVILLQTMLVLFNVTWNYLIAYRVIAISTELIAVASLIIGIFLTITAIGLVNEISRLSEKEYELEVNQAIAKKDKELITLLRSHRHDFQNHLQVILGLVQLGRNESAANYIKEVTRSLKQQSSDAGKIKNLEIAALFLTKKIQAEERKIKLQLEMKSDLAGLNISATDISRIMGNLIDNAFDAVEELEKGEQRAVKVCFAEDEHYFYISVLNKRPLIPKEIQAKVFEHGFSTKGVGGSGLGLPIVKELTEKHQGSVSLVSDAERGTVFSLRFPRLPANSSK